MSFTLQATVLAIGLFFGMLLLPESGRRIGLRRLAQDAEGARAGFGVVEEAVFGLMGLRRRFTRSLLQGPRGCAHSPLSLAKN